VSEELIDRTTDHYKAAVAAGFTFDTPRVLQDVGLFDGDTRTIVVYPFRCVCGRQELYQRAMSSVEITRRIGGATPLDVAQVLDSLGSFSRQHLREDGYDDANIDRIRWPFDMLERVARLERELHGGGWWGPARLVTPRTRR
jgi:hypothetical protein